MKPERFGVNSIRLNGGTDLVRLHKVFEMDNPGRGSGRTFADCHTVAGVLYSTDESGVLCQVLKFDRMQHMFEMMARDVFPEYGIRCVDAFFNMATVVLANNMRKKIRFVLVDDETALMGNTWPVVNFTEFMEGGNKWEIQKRK